MKGLASNQRRHKEMIMKIMDIAGALPFKLLLSLTRLTPSLLNTCLTTIHSNSGESSYKRMMTLAKRKFQMADEILLQIMVEAFPIIVYTKQLDDGSRKIMEIIEGEDFVKGKTVTRTLFRYDVLDNTVDADGSIKISGKHTQCSDISDVLRKRMMENGISARELAAFTMKKEGANDVD